MSCKLRVMLRLNVVVRKSWVETLHLISILLSIIGNKLGSRVSLSNLHWKRQVNFTHEFVLVITLNLDICLLWVFVLPGRGLCDELITLPEESYRLLRRCVWSRNIKNGCSIYIYDIGSLKVNQLLFCVSLKIYNKFANYFCELKFSGNTHQRP